MERRGHTEQAGDARCGEAIIEAQREQEPVARSKRIDRDAECSVALNANGLELRVVSRQIRQQIGIDIGANGIGQSAPCDP